MKLSITKTQLLHILSQHFNVTVEDIALLKGPKKKPDPVLLYTKLVEGMAKLLDVPFHAVSKTVLDPCKKIMAIKTLRVIVNELSSKSVEGQNSKLPGDYLGLAEAKYAVEDWSNWLEFIRVNNKYPKYESYGWNYSQK